jgi:molecular chaperone GrpE
MGTGAVSTVMLIVEKEKGLGMQETEKNQESVAGHGAQPEHAQESGQTPAGDTHTGQEDSCCPELERCAAELAASRQQLLRSRADLENLIRRVEKERARFVSVGQRAVLLDLLSVVDDFDRALRDHSPQELAADLASEREVAQDKTVWLAGFSLIRSSLYKLLENYGVTPMSQAQYAHFDPHFHEAIMHSESAGHKRGDIVHVLLNGFMLGDQVLRPAQVSVAK